MANKKDQEKLMCCRTEIRTTEAMNREIEEKAENLNMGKAQYIIHCIENQPAIPVITYQSDDLDDIIDILCDIKHSLEGLADGVVMTGSVTEDDIRQLLNMNYQINQQYLELVQRYDEQRERVTKTARRLVRSWKAAEREQKKKE